MTQEEITPEVNTTSETHTGCCMRKYSPICGNIIFWMSVLASAFLIAGLIAPGWLRVHADLRYNDQYHYSDFYFTRAYQDYGLWSVAQCVKTNSKEIYACETRSYNFLDGHADKTQMAWLDISDIQFSDICFNGIALIFSYKTMWIMQTLLVVGTLVSVFNIYMAFQLRSTSTVRFCSPISQQNAIAFSIIPAILTFIPVFVIVDKHFSIEKSQRRDIQENDITLFGITFAALGSTIMCFYSAVMLIHTACGCLCASPICAEPLISYHADEIPEDKDENQKEQLCEVQIDEEC